MNCLHCNKPLARKYVRVPALGERRAAQYRPEDCLYVQLPPHPPKRVAGQLVKRCKRSALYAATWDVWLGDLKGYPLGDPVFCSLRCGMRYGYECAQAREAEADLLKTRRG